MADSVGLPSETNHASLDRRLAALVTHQHGVVSLAQLRAFGLSAPGARYRVATGRLHRVHRGVYAVGRPRLTREGVWMAAVLACGRKAALSHRSAAAHLGLLRGDGKRVDVTAPGRAGRSRPGIAAHSGRLHEDELTEAEGVPCTTVARTLLDLAEVVDRRRLEIAVEQAEVLRVFDLRAVSAVLARAVGRRGAPLLAAVLAEANGHSTITRSELEERFLALCRAAGLPPPEVNAWVSLEDGTGVEADFVWRDARLIVETDGYGVHGTPRAFERDRLRDQRVVRAGWRPVRFTWRQIVDTPAGVTQTLVALIL